MKDLISTSFLELKSKRIRYLFVAGKKHDYYMAVEWVVVEYRIFIEKEILRFSRQAFIGCIAHELAHIVIAVRKSFFSRLRGYLAGTNNETEEERDADLLVVDRGLGEALLQFHQEHGKKYKSYNASEGLTKREIRKILKRS